jgi:hypothetical protein
VHVEATTGSPFAKGADTIVAGTFAHEGLAGWRRLGAAALVASVVIAAAATSAPAAAPPPPAPLSAARLQGFFVFNGRITTAVNVPGERTGQSIRRVWAFHPLCPAGVCAAVKLVRQRGGALDTVILHRRSPAVYAGTSTFYAPARCHGVRYAKGELVSFTLTVRVTAAAVLDGTTAQATGLRAFYTSLSREGLTSCVSVPARDAAEYLGALLGQPPADSIRSEASTRLTAAS